MIWGVTLEPGRLYTETVEEETRLSFASLECRSEHGEKDSGYCHIIMKTSKSEYLLCTLVHGSILQQSLDLKLMPKEQVTFSVQGTSVVYLMGYSSSYPDEGEDVSFLDHEDSTTRNNEWETITQADVEVKLVKEEPVDDMEEEVQSLGNKDPNRSSEGQEIRIEDLEAGDHSTNSDAQRRTDEQVIEYRGQFVESDGDRIDLEGHIMDTERRIMDAERRIMERQEEMMGTGDHSNGSDGGMVGSSEQIVNTDRDLIFSGQILREEGHLNRDVGRSGGEQRGEQGRMMEGQLSRTEGSAEEEVIAVEDDPEIKEELTEQIYNDNVSKQSAASTHESYGPLDLHTHHSLSASQMSLMQTFHGQMSPQGMSSQGNSSAMNQNLTEELSIESINSPHHSIVQGQQRRTMQAPIQRPRNNGIQRQNMQKQLLTRPLGGRGGGHSRLASHFSRNAGQMRHMRSPNQRQAHRPREPVRVEPVGIPSTIGQSITTHGAVLGGTPQHLSPVQSGQIQTGGYQLDNIPSHSGLALTQTEIGIQDMTRPSTSGPHELSPNVDDLEDPAVLSSGAEDEEREFLMDKPTQCHFCPKVFPTGKRCRGHERSVHRKRFYKCRYCIKRFFSKEDWRRHDRIHTGVKPYSCSFCGKSFNRNSSRRHHELIHTGRKRYECSLCDVGFDRKHLLEEHNRSVHAQKLDVI